MLRNTTLCIRVCQSEVLNAFYYSPVDRHYSNFVLRAVAFTLPFLLLCKTMPHKAKVWQWITKAGHTRMTTYAYAYSSIRIRVLLAYGTRMRCSLILSCTVQVQHEDLMNQINKILLYLLLQLMAVYKNYILQIYYTCYQLEKHCSCFFFTAKQWQLVQQDSVTKF